MATAIGSMNRKILRKSGDKLNVLTSCTHESWESNLCKTGHTFYAFRSPQVKDWNRAYRPLPENYILLNPSRQQNQIPADVDFDLVLSQNKFGQYQILSQFAKMFHLPILSIEHTLTVPSWPKAHVEYLKTLKGCRNAFISKYSIANWGWSEDDPSVRVIHHGIDTERFSPNEMVVDKKSHVLSVCNDWVNRDWCCGFNLWREISQGIPTLVVGDTPGLSKPAASLAELVLRYREASVFLNTSLISPIPTVVLEAMSCGLPVVSTNNCMLPEVVEHGVNGFLSNDPKQLREYCQLLLSDKQLAKKMGEAARQTVLSKFSLEKFVKNWDSLLRETAECFYEY